MNSEGSAPDLVDFEDQIEKEVLKTTGKKIRVNCVTEEGIKRSIDEFKISKEAGKAILLQAKKHLFDELEVQKGKKQSQGVKSNI